MGRALAVCDHGMVCVPIMAWSEGLGRLCMCCAEALMAMVWSAVPRRSWQLVCRGTLAIGYAAGAGAGADGPSDACAWVAGGVAWGDAHAV